MNGTGHDWQKLKAFRFGDSPELATRLAALVVAGVKTATCSAARHGTDSRIGEQQVCLNGEDTPVAIIKTKSLQTLAFAAVTPDMAAREGEGDLSLAYWRDAHQRFFEREGSWAPDMEVIYETFRLVDILDLHFAAEARLHVDAERAAAYAAGYKALGS